MRVYAVLPLVCIAFAASAKAQATSVFHVTQSSNYTYSREYCSLRLEGLLDGKKVELATNGCDRILPPGDYTVRVRKDATLSDGLLQRFYDLDLPNGKHLLAILAGMSE